MAFANVARFLPERAAAQPGACAVRAPVGDEPGTPGRIRYEARTFAELNAESDAVGRLLRERGVRHGTRVLLLVQPGLDLLRCVFALFKLGAIPILLDPGMGLKNFLECVRHSAPTALVGVARAHWLARFFPRTVRSVAIRVRVGGPAWERALVAHRAISPLELAPTRADELAAVLFTSGSTGAPKGVCYEHGMFEAQVGLIRDRFRIAPGEVDLPLLPIFALFNPALGMTTIVPEMDPAHPAACDPARIAQAIRQNEVTNSFGSPALWTRLVRHCEEKNLTFPSLRRVLVAGAPVQPGLLRRLQQILPNGTAHVPYGATEALPVSSISSAEVLGETWALTERGRGSCVGSLFPGLSARIIPWHEGPLPGLAAAGELPLGEIGEIIVRGPVVTRTYDQLPEATAAAKIYDSVRPWHRMGDLGYLDERGRFWFCGRAAERVETAAGTLYTEEAEAIFNRHPRVARTALIGLGPLSRGKGKIPALVVEPEPGQFPRDRAAEEKFAAELRALAAEFPRLHAVQQIFFRRTLPVDVRHNAKIHRLELAREYQRKTRTK
jgi:olefin beta-lactone synthetase